LEFTDGHKIQLWNGILLTTGLVTDNLVLILFAIQMVVVPLDPLLLMAERTTFTQIPDPLVRDV